jgi:hypothetical protein
MYSLEERAVLAHRAYPNIRISKSSLHSIYKKNGVKLKVLQWKKGPKTTDAVEILLKMEEL